MAQESGPCSYMENHVECANTSDLWLTLLCRVKHPPSAVLDALEIHTTLYKHSSLI